MAVTAEVFTVSCGPLMGRLHMRAFLCPGIHQECIEVEGSGTMVTPKAFSLMGNKGSLKDWKNAVRVNGLSLRKRMELGDIDFYNHADSCTGKCASRHVGNSKYEAKIESLKLADEHDMMTIPTLLNSTSLSEHAYTLIREGDVPTTHVDVLVKSEPLGDYGDTDPPYPKSSTSTSIIAAAPVSINGPIKWMGKAKPRAAAAAAAAAAEEGAAPVTLEAFNFPDTGDILEESESFWRGIMDIGLLDPFVREIKTSLDGMKNDLRRGADFQETSRKMSQIVTELGLVTKLKFRLARHKSETEKQKLSLIQEIEALRRKVAETEQKQRELKRKSERFDELILCRAKVPKPSSSAHSESASSLAKLEQTDEYEDDEETEAESALLEDPLAAQHPVIQTVGTEEQVLSALRKSSALARQRPTQPPEQGETVDL